MPPTGYTPPQANSTCRIVYYPDSSEIESLRSEIERLKGQLKTANAEVFRLRNKGHQQKR